MFGKLTVLGTCDFCKGDLEVIPYDKNLMIIRCERCHMTYGKESEIDISKFKKEVAKK